MHLHRPELLLLLLLLLLGCAGGPSGAVGGPAYGVVIGGYLGACPQGGRQLAGLLGDLLRARDR